MKLKSVQIFDFKSIKNIELEINTNQLCLVGKNESGKSSLLSAISMLNILDNKLSKDTLNKNSSRYPEGYPFVVGCFSLTQNDYKRLHNLLIEYIPNPPLAAESSDCLLQLKRWGNGFSNISITIFEENRFGYNISKNIDQLGAFYDRFFIEIYPDIQLHEKETMLIEPCSVEELRGENENHDTFRKLLFLGGVKNWDNLDSSKKPLDLITTHLSDIEINLTEIFRKHYKQDSEISFKIMPSIEGKLNLIIIDGSRKSFMIGERSPGFQYYFAFLINKLYAQVKNKVKETIFVLDEPGIGLHPQGAKDLLVTFDEICQASQIIYTTHNPFMVLRNSLESLYYVEKSTPRGTTLNTKPYLKKYQILRKELGVLLNDSFLIGDVNLIVEGASEQYVFHRLSQEPKYSNLTWLNIYNADGVANIPQAVNYLGKNNLNLAGVILLDSDTEANNVKKNKSYLKNINTSHWAQIEVNDAFSDKKDRTFEDLFPAGIYILAFNQYCQDIAEAQFDKHFVPYEITDNDSQPLIVKLSAYYKKFLPEGSSSSISKQIVLGKVLDIIDEEEQELKDIHLREIYKICDLISLKIDKIQQNVKN